MKNPHRLFLIDGAALFYRSYFALIRTPLVNSKGEILVPFSFCHSCSKSCLMKNRIIWQ